MITTQYRLYAMTEPYVAEFSQPKMALKIPQPPPPFISALQHYTESATRLLFRYHFYGYGLH